MELRVNKSGFWYKKKWYSVDTPNSSYLLILPMKNGNVKVWAITPSIENENNLRLVYQGEIQSYS